MGTDDSFALLAKLGEKVVPLIFQRMTVLLCEKKLTSGFG